ncbi:MAG: DUF3127 domain-containing protein [Muribaculaceae bacterium]|nr:DUF3127 domain-containing protein [Muribaculaceae bacterium]
MIKLTATSLIHSISQVIVVPSKTGGAPFQKQELVLNDSWERDGVQHPNFVVIEFSGDKMAQLANFYPGQRVTVEAYVNGREYNGRIFNTIKGQSVTLYQPQQQSAPPPQAPPSYPQQMAPPPSYPQGPTASNLPFPT